MQSQITRFPLFYIWDLLHQKVEGYCPRVVVHRGELWNQLVQFTICLLRSIRLRLGGLKIVRRGGFERSWT